MQATLAAYQTLEGFVPSKIGALGVSNIYEADELAWLISKAKVPVSVVQNRWYEGNGWDWEGELYVCDRTDAVYDLCQKHNIQYQSFWTLTGSPTLSRFKPLVDLAKRNKCTPQQAIYRLCQM